MGKPTGFLEYERQENEAIQPLSRITNFNEFHPFLDEETRRKQGARCMNCGVPFCQSAIKLKNMVTGCPLHNLIPEWNDEIYNGNDKRALSRLLKTNPFPEFTGRVCPALCEKACLNGLDQEPVTIKENELYTIETAYTNNWMKAFIPSVRSDKKVAIIGGGNTAMDSVRTARRLGAERAMIVYRRSEEEMPARLEEVKHAKEEGVEFMTLHNPIEYIADEKGRVKQVVLQKMELGEPDASGRRSPVAIPGATETIDIDMAIVSVGVSPNPIVPSSIKGLELGRKGTIAVNDNMQSSIPTIYAGGDIVRGGATVILAMGDGRRAAAAMDRQLRQA